MNENKKTLPSSAISKSGKCAGKTYVHENWSAFVGLIKPIQTFSEMSSSFKNARAASNCSMFSTEKRKMRIVNMFLQYLWGFVHGFGNIIVADLFQISLQPFTKVTKTSTGDFTARERN